MTQLEDLLVLMDFLRIHKSYLVNMAYLQSFKVTRVAPDSRSNAPVGAFVVIATKQKFVRWQAQPSW